MKRFLLSCLLVTVAGTVALTSQSDGRRPTVLVDAVALDKNGAPVTDLKPADLEVWIGRFQVPIQTLEVVTPESERAGRIIVVLMDDMTVPLSSIARAQEAARRLVTRMLPGDQAAIVMLSDPTFESTSDMAKLRRAVDRYTVRATGVMRQDEIGAHMLKTVAGISGALVEAGDGRKVIVGIGSGWLYDRPIPPPQMSSGDLLPEWIDAMRALSRSHAAFYAIDPSGLGTTRTDGGDSGFARETGGHAYINFNDLELAADRILRETSSYYLITTANPPVGGSGLRQLEVRSLRKGVTVRARRAVH
jgi:VWFA-related protein